MSISERDFNAVTAAKPNKKKREAPFSLRLSFEEKALLRAAANGVPLGAYIKAKLFDEPLEKVRRRNTNPVKDHEALGRVLGSLGSPAFRRTSTNSPAHPIRERSPSRRKSRRSFAKPALMSKPCVKSFCGRLAACREEARHDLERLPTRQCC